jgi:tetratricopeptide (TPR) repeat protein
MHLSHQSNVIQNSSILVRYRTKGPLVMALFRSGWVGAVALMLWTTHGSAQAADAQRLFQEAVTAQQRGDNATAARDYRELLRTHPEATDVRINLAATLANLGRFSEAIEQCRIVLATDPSNRMARMNLALAYRDDKDLANATKELEQLHGEDPSDGKTAMLLADCLAQSGRYAEVISLLAPLEPADGDNPDLEWLLGSAMIHAGRPQEGVARVEKAAAQGTNPDAYLLAGQTRLAMSQFDLAQHDADGARRLNPNLAGLSTLSGMILEQQGDYDAAVAALQKALAMNADDFNAHLYLGGIYYFKRDMGQAKVHLTHALQLQPSSAQARYELALVARADGQLTTAMQYLETLVRQTPNWLQPHVELAALYYRLHRPEDGAREREMVDRMMAAQQQAQSQAAH